MGFPPLPALAISQILAAKPMMYEVPGDGRRCAVLLFVVSLLVFQNFGICFRNEVNKRGG